MQNAKIHKMPVNNVAIHPAGRYFLSGGDDNNEILSDQRRLVLVSILMPHKEKMLHVQFSGDGDFFTAVALTTE
jgi:WD40 repeat protein